MICRITIPVILLFWVLCRPMPLHAQKSGIIQWNDGTASRIDSFSEISIRLRYHWWSRKASTNDPGEYFRKIPVDGLREFVFVRQNGRYSGGFYYLVTLRGYDPDGTLTELKIPVWDWLDMTYTGADSNGNTRITFFHQKRRMKILRIDFEDKQIKTK